MHTRNVNPAEVQQYEDKFARLRAALDEGDGSGAVEGDPFARVRETTREVAMQDEQIREALNEHWQASAAGDLEAEHDIYADDAVCDYPQSGERILGRRNLQALRSHHPGKPSGFAVKRVLGKGDLWITEYTITYQGRAAFTVSIMEFRDGKVVHETQYFADPFEAPAWRSQWVQRMA